MYNDTIKYIPIFEDKFLLTNIIHDQSIFKEIKRITFLY